MYLTKRLRVFGNEETELKHANATSKTQFLN